MIPWITHPDYDIPLPPGHRFTSTKFSDLFELLKKSKYRKYAIVLVPEKAEAKQVSIAHCSKYVEKIEHGLLDEKEQRRLGLQWSPVLAKRSFIAVNGSLLAAKSALQYGVSCHLAGGTHHSHFDFGSGFCVFNDLAYTALTLTKTKEVKKILIFDCDVHQGDGTARILENNDNTFTCSIHATKNFPYRKASSDLDIDLEDGLPWSLYRERLIEGLNKCLERFSPDLILYVAGVDVHENDKLGRLGIDDEGLFEREIMVLNFFKKKGIPLATVMGGGYSDDRKELAKRHSTVIKAAHEVWSYV